MAKTEQEKTEEMQPVANETPTAQSKWMSNMRAKYPDIESDDELYQASMDGYDKEHDYAKRSRDENARMAEAIAGEPTLASLYAEIFERGKDGHPELALLNIGDLLKSLINGDISSDEYIAEKNKRAKADKERQENTQKQQDFVIAWCEKKGYDPEEWMTRLKEKLFDPFTSFQLAEEQLNTIDNMLNYDEDVAAAEVRGRNANITAQRKASKASNDGLPSAASAASASAPAPKSDIASIAARREYMRNL